MGGWWWLVGCGWWVGLGYAVGLPYLFSFFFFSRKGRGRAEVPAQVPVGLYMNYPKSKQRG